MISDHRRCDEEKRAMGQRLLTEKVTAVERSGKKRDILIEVTKIATKRLVKLCIKISHAEGWQEQALKMRWVCQF